MSPFDVLLTRRGVGEDGRQQIVGLHALNRQRHPFAAAESGERERSTGVPAEARAEDRRRQHSLLEHILHARGAQESKDVGERKAVLLGQGDVDSLIGCRRLQLEVERHAEPLSQRKPPRAVDASAERRVEHELHAAALVKESLGDDTRLRRDAAENRAAADDVVDDLLGPG